MISCHISACESLPPMISGANGLRRGGVAASPRGEYIHRCVTQSQYHHQAILGITDSDRSQHGRVKADHGHEAVGPEHIHVTWQLSQNSRAVLCRLQ